MHVLCERTRGKMLNTAQLWHRWFWEHTQLLLPQPGKLVLQEGDLPSDLVELLSDSAGSKAAAPVSAIFHIVHGVCTLLRGGENKGPKT